MRKIPPQKRFLFTAFAPLPLSLPLPLHTRTLHHSQRHKARSPCAQPGRNWLGNFEIIQHCTCATKMQTLTLIQYLDIKGAAVSKSTQKGTGRVPFFVVIEPKSFGSMKFSLKSNLQQKATQGSQNYAKATRTPTRL